MDGHIDHPTARMRGIWAMAWGLLLLVTIAGQALIPVGWSRAPSSGSAFSAGTVEVSLGPTRRIEIAAVRTEVGPTGPGAPPAAAIAPLPLAQVTTLGDRPVAHWPQAPPVPLPGDPATTAFDARGPPRI